MELFKLHEPAGDAVPVIANLPHSGTYVPPKIAEQFTPEHLASLPHTDWHLDRLYGYLPELGVTVLQATHSRYVVDLNRAISDPLLGPFHTSTVAEYAPAQSSQRTNLQSPVYRTHPTAEQLERGVQQYYLPYFEQLDALLDQFLARFGQVYLLHLHSFYGPLGHVIDLGDGGGQGCCERMIESVERQFRAAGYAVARNSPYFGNFAAQRFGSRAGVESLQIEIRYPVYLGEQEFPGAAHCGSAANGRRAGDVSVDIRWNHRGAYGASVIECSGP